MLPDGAKRREAFRRFAEAGKKAPGGHPSIPPINLAACLIGQTPAFLQSFRSGLDNFKLMAILSPHSPLVRTMSRD